MIRSQDIKFIYKNTIEQLELGILKITIYNSTLKIKYLGINIIKHLQDKHAENYKTQMTKIKEY